MSGSSRLRPAFPWGLVGMLALVWTVERLEIGSDLAYLGNVAASWRVGGRAAHRTAKDANVLYLGDSEVKFGILPKVVKREVGLKGYNLALQSGAAPSSYFLLKRAIAAGARPAAVVVDHAIGCLEEGPASLSRPYPWAELLEFREAFELAWVARDPELFAKINLGRLLPSYRSRFEVRASVLKCLRGELFDQREVTSMLLRNWAMNAGAQPNWKNPSFVDDVPPPASAHARGTWRCHPVNEHYVHKFIDLAERNRISVYWLLPPLSPGTQTCREFVGDEGLYDRFVAKVLKAHPNLSVIDGRHAGFEPTVFIDGVHLDRDGAVALSQGIADVLKGDSAGRTGRGRVRPLPAFRQRPTDAAIEEVGESLRVVVEEKRRRLGR